MNTAARQIEHGDHAALVAEEYAFVAGGQNRYIALAKFGLHQLGVYDMPHELRR